MQVRARRKSKITIKQILWIVALLIAFVVLLKSLYTFYLRYSESSRDLAQSESSLATLSTRESNLEKAIADLKTERGQEQEIRTRFNVAKAGEEVVVVVDDTSTTTATSTPKTGWWRSIVNFFTN